MRSPVADLLADLARGFERLGMRWYLFGAQAAIVYGVARLTADVDATVHTEAAELTKATEFLLAFRRRRRSAPDRDP